MGKLRAAMRFCTYVHDHIVKDLRSYSKGATNMGLIQKKVYDIDKLILRLFSLFQKDKLLRKEAKQIREKIFGEVDIVQNSFRLDKVMKKKEGWHEKEFNDSMSNLEKDLQALLVKRSLEDVIFADIDKLVKGVQEIIDEIDKKYSGKDFNERALMGDTAKILRHLLRDIKRRFEREKELIVKIEQGDNKAESELKDFETTYHKVYEIFKLGNFLELPAFEELDEELRHYFVRKRVLFGKKFDYSDKKKVKAALKKYDNTLYSRKIPVSQETIEKYFRKRNVLKDFARFMHESRKKV
jgi:hypothetical protein